MRPNGFKSAVQNVAPGRLLRTEPATLANASQTLVLSDDWVDAHITALARAEMNLEKVLKGSGDFLQALQSFVRCVYAMPSGSERYQYPFALGIHFALKDFLQERLEARDLLEQHLSQIRHERVRLSDLISLLNKRPELKAQIQSSFKHVYNQQTKTLDVFMSISTSVKDQWEMNLIIDSLQKLEMFKSSFLSDQFADTKDFLWDWFDRLAKAIDDADNMTSQQMIDIESGLEAEYVRKHLRTPGDEIWLPENLHQQLESQKMEREAAAKATLQDHLIKAHGAKAIRDVDVDAVLQEEAGFRAATDSYFRRLCLLNNACSYLRQAMDSLNSLMSRYKQLLDVQLLLYRLPRAASAPAVAFETAMIGVIHRVVETSTAIERDVEKLVQSRSEELWAPFIQPDAASLALEKVTEQLNARGDIAYYRSKIVELEQPREAVFGSNHDKIARNRLKLGEIQREYKGESDDLRADFAHIEVVCKEYYRAFELNLFDTIDRVLAPLSKSLKSVPIPTVNGKPRQIHSATNSRVIPQSNFERPVARRGTEIAVTHGHSDTEQDNRLSRISTSLRNMRARDIQLANARASRRPPPLQPPEQLLQECLELCDIFAEVQSKITPSDFQHIQFSKLVEGSNLTGRLVEWLRIRHVGRDASQSAQSLQGGTLLAINGQSVIGLPIQAVQKLLEDLQRASTSARVLVRQRRNPDDAFSHYLQRTLNDTEQDITPSQAFNYDYRLQCWHDRAWTSVQAPISRQLILAAVAVKTNNTTSRLSTNLRSTMKARPTSKNTASKKAHTMKPNPKFNAQSKSPKPTHQNQTKTPPMQRQRQRPLPRQHSPRQPTAKTTAPPLEKGRKPPPAKHAAAIVEAAPPVSVAMASVPPSIDLMSHTTPVKSVDKVAIPSTGSLRKSSQKEVSRRGSVTSSNATPSKGAKRNFLDAAVEAKLFDNADLTKPQPGSPYVRSKSFVKPVVAADLPPEFQSSIPSAPPPPPQSSPAAPRPGPQRRSRGTNRPPNLRPPSTRVSSLRSSGRQPSLPSSPSSPLSPALSTDSPRAGARTSSKIGALFGRDFSSNSVGSSNGSHSPRNRSRPGSKRISKRVPSERASTRVARANVVLAPPPITTKPYVLEHEDPDKDDVDAAAAVGGHHRRESSLAAIRAQLEEPYVPSAKPKSRNNSLVRESENGTFVFGATAPIENVAAAQSIDSVLRARATRRRTTSTPPQLATEQHIPIPADIVSTPIWQRRRRSSMADTAISDALARSNFEN